MTVPGFNPRSQRKTWAGRETVECSGKDKMSAVQAKELAKRMRERDRRVDPYHCTFCRSWHVGSKPAAIKGNTHGRPPRHLQRQEDDE